MIYNTQFLKYSVTHFFNSFILFMCLFSAVLGHHCCTGFSLVVEVGGSSPVAVCGPLVVGLLLLWSVGSGVRRLQWWQPVGSVVVTLKL